MAHHGRVTILLADEDALRRDGLAAVLSGTQNFEIMGGVPDGEAALEEIRRLRPDVAVVDLNLPKVHGIELVRRVRAEILGTKVLILAGTADDEIIREVVRAGGDGYLLKFGPARHLIDAISYVRDGGQYFSPQLGRDGRSRHLLEEPPRIAPESFSRAQEYREEAGDPVDPRQSGESRERSARTQRSRRRSNDSMQFRERIREQAASGENLDDRDYEIMTMMADGIRPILDRLDEIDNRVAQMEVGAEPVPSDPRGWLNRELADTLRDPRNGGEVAVLGRSVSDLEARLPELIEETVTRRFQQMAGRLQQEIEETHVRTLETFVKNIQVKLVKRVAALETDMGKQAEAMNQLRESSFRTEDNLSRLITGVDRLAQELPRRINTQNIPVPEAPLAEQAEPLPQVAKPLKRKPAGRNKGIKIFWIAAAAILLMVVPGYFLAGRIDRSSSVASAAGAASSSSAPATATRPAPPPAGADTKTKMQAAQEYADRKDYAMAEDVYKQVIKTEPNNVEALKALASVLYRQDKIDESAAILDRIPKD
jgi:DNA-binding NarL/FixJ family response regulator/TolA-binding protein